MSNDSDAQRFKKVVDETWQENLRLLEDSPMEILIAWAKQKVVKNYKEKYGGEIERQWLATYVDSYQDQAYRIAVYVLEGSPAKGYFIVNYGTETVVLYDCHDNKICSKHNWEMKF